MRFIITNMKYQMPEDAAEGNHKTIEDRLGYWTDEGEIYIYRPALTAMQTFGFAAHEALEYILVKKLGGNERNPWLHRYCCIIELIITFGRAWDVLCWR